MVLNYTTVEGKSLSDLLNSICISAYCNIFVDNNNNIVVRSRNAQNGVTKVFSDQTNITRIEVSKSLLNESQGLKLGYSASAVSDIIELTSLKSYEVQNGDVVIPNVTFGNHTAYDIDKIVVSADGGVVARITGYTSNSNEISLYLSVSGIPDKEEPVEEGEEIYDENGELITSRIVAGTDTVDIVVYGKTIISTEAFVERGKSGQEIKVLSIESPLTQSLKDAEALIDKYWTLVQLPLPFIKVDVLVSDFSYNLGDMCEIEATTRNLKFFGYIHSVDYEFFGGAGVSCTVGVKYLKSAE